MQHNIHYRKSTKFGLIFDLGLGLRFMAVGICDVVGLNYTRRECRANVFSVVSCREGVCVLLGAGFAVGGNVSWRAGCKTWTRFPSTPNADDLTKLRLTGFTGSPTIRSPTESAAGF